ncbi:hypothetical protein OK016_15250 [Vibrio chagasii]|nr:hypothetical protein [Vibrio chagasii]
MKARMPDLLIIDGNPLEGVACVAPNTDTQKLIMKDGKVYKTRFSVQCSLTGT